MGPMDQVYIQADKVTFLEFPNYLPSFHQFFSSEQNQGRLAYSKKLEV